MQLDHFNFSGPSTAHSNHDNTKSNKYPTEPVQQPLHAVAAGATLEDSDSWSDDTEGDLSSTGPSPSGTPSPVVNKKSGGFGRTNITEGESSSDEISQNPSDSLERVINIKNCPLFHCSRLNSKAEIDIVTHLAMCASQDWNLNQVDRIVASNFVTASQASQEKWYTISDFNGL